MKHKLISQTSDLHPYEIVKVRLLADSVEENKSIAEIDSKTQDYLTFNLDAVEIIESNPPDFLIKRVKKNIGFGK